MIVIVMVFIISEILGFMVVNGLYKLYMKITGADMMYFDGKKKLLFSLLTGGLICKLFFDFIVDLGRGVM